MTAMGIGTLVSRFFNKNLIYWFILVELLIAIIGGLSVPILYYVYSIQFFYYPIMCLLIIAIGTLIGVEIPLLTRIMEEYFQLKENISNVLSLDYLGAFLASLAFPFILLPFLGIFNTSLFTGLLNLLIGILTFIILSICKMPYTLLISVIIGITNIIPFFGPFFGAIPSVIIVLFVSPTKALWLVLIIFIIQQIDGNIIGPKILGDSIGVSAFWILFSLLIFSKLLGFVGMIVGVPIFAVVYTLIKEIVELRLKKRGLPVSTEDYK
jgi:hypothetical protein